MEPNGEWQEWRETPKLLVIFGYKPWRRMKRTAGVGGIFIDWEYADNPRNK